jgi:hypothetical protein
MFYFFYAAANILYVFSLSSPKCLECIRKACPCDDNFFKVDFNNLGREKVRLKRMRIAALRKAESLDCRIEFFKKT